MKVLVTGAAGFIGMHVCAALLARGDEVIGIDSLNAYYEPQLKLDRLAQLTAHHGFRFDRIDIAERDAAERSFAAGGFECVVHLAAQAGVRHSLTHPHDYVQSNLTGFLHVLEGCRQHRIAHLVYASSSSVYGGQQVTPFSEAHRVDHPISLYAATKKANELMAHSYSHLYGLPTTGLRFFTVYGPWGRPDMAYFLFTRSILEGSPIDVFNHGDLQRDFTYVDDVVTGVLAVLDKPATSDPGFDGRDPHPATSHAPYRLFNIGNQHPVPLMDFIAEIERALDRRAVIRFLPMQPGDPATTHADVDALTRWIGFRPATPLGEGIDRFVAWYRERYRV